MEDRQRAQRLFAWLLVAGIVLIFTGIVALGSDRGGLASSFRNEMAALMMGLVAAGVWCIVYGSMMLGRLNIANYNDAREQTIAESDEGKLIVNSDAAALRAMYTDEQICSLLGVPEATDDEIDRARARIERKRRKDQLASGLCAMHHDRRHHCRFGHAVCARVSRRRTSGSRGPSAACCAPWPPSRSAPS